MNQQTTIEASDVRRVDRQQAFAHRAGETAAWLELMRSLEPGEWRRPTVCAEWDVADIAAHLIGQAEEVIRPWRFPLRDRRAARRYPDVVPLLDAHMMVQADDRRGMPAADMIATFERLWPRANRAILHRPFLRGVTVRCADMPYRFFDRMALGYIHDVLLPRDLWTHRDDVCQAIGRPFAPGSYGADLVAQVLLDLEVAEVWSGPAVALRLTGPAGGNWQLGSGTPAGTVRVDAVALMRSISGRDDHAEVEPVTGDPDVAGLVAAIRMPF